MSSTSDVMTGIVDFYQCYSKDETVLFNGTLNTFYLRLYGVGHMVKDHSDSREEIRCRYYLDYSLQLAARVVLYAPGYNIPLPLHQSWITGWNEKTFSGSTLRDRSDDLSHKMTKSFSLINLLLLFIYLFIYLLLFFYNSV